MTFPPSIFHFFFHLVSTVAPILARPSGAFIYVDLTGSSLETFRALALVAAGADLKEGYN